MEQAINQNGTIARYTYNGLGHRVGKQVGNPLGTSQTMPQPFSGEMVEAGLNPMEQLKSGSLTPTKQIDYTLDLTRRYHNLLQQTEDHSHTQTYLWDGNVVGMLEKRREAVDSYYLQDDLGSPIRLLYENGEVQESYGYGAFGEELYQNQSVSQPFGFTGYHRDEVAGTYYAQAREYQAEAGRFVSEDIMKGNAGYPFTLNTYGYCWNQPLNLVDLNGQSPEEVEYVGAVYLLNEGYGVFQGGAYGQGHAAVLLVKSNGKSEFYSYAGESNINAFTKGSKGYLSTQVGENKKPKDINTETFFKDQGAYADNVENQGKNIRELDKYSHGVYIPITNAEGVAMHDKAMSIRKNPGKYNLWNHNCGQVAQIILKAGGKDFASTTFDWWDTRPDSVYNDIIKEIDGGERDGWMYGPLSGYSVYGGLVVGVGLEGITRKIFLEAYNKVMEECVE